MNTKQVIAVIGSQGSLGYSFVRSLSEGNYRILFCPSQAGDVHFLFNDIKMATPTADVEIVDDVVEACWEADMIILAVPSAAQKQLAERIRSVVNQKVIISISKADNDRYDGLMTPGISAAEEPQKQLPNAKVIRLSIMMSADVKNSLTVKDQKVNCILEGPDHEALQVACDLAKAAGLNPKVRSDLTTA